MGIYSTLTVSRETALKVIKGCLEQASNEELGKILFDLFSNEYLYNYTVVDVSNSVIDLDSLEGIKNDKRRI